MDEELLRGRAAAKKNSKKTAPELLLPYVPGGKQTAKNTRGMSLYVPLSSFKFIKRAR